MSTRLASAGHARRGRRESLRRDERGVVVVMTALVLLPLMGMLALVVDIGYAHAQQRMAQNVADSGAVNAANIVGRHLQRGAASPLRDTHVATALQAVATRSSGGYSGGLTGEYVRYDGTTVTVVGSVGTGAICADGVAAGCIPGNATGVRAAPSKTFNTFFAPAIGALQLGSGARAAAVNATVRSYNARAPNFMPYAMWTGEDGAPAGTPDYLCRDVLGLPKPLINPATGLPALQPNGVLPAYDHSCNIPIGAQFVYRANDYQAAAVSADNPNWQTTSTDFKGFLRLDAATPTISVGGYVASGGSADSQQDVDRLHTCYVTRCTLVIPMIAYAGGNGSDVNVLVTGFATVRPLENPWTLGPPDDWRLQFVPGPVNCCPASFEFNVAPGASTPLYTRLVR